MFGSSPFDAELEEGLAEPFPRPQSLALALAGLLIAIGVFAYLSSAKGESGLHIVVGVFGLWGALASIVGWVNFGFSVARQRRLEGRRESIEAAAQAAERGSVVTLAALLENTTDPVVQRRIGQILADLPGEHPAEPLLAMVRHSHGIVRDGAARALARSKDWTGIEELIQALSADDLAEREAAASVLRFVRASCALPEERRRRLSEALGEREEPAVVAGRAAKESPAAAPAAGDLVSTILGHPDAGVRERALRDYISERRATEVLGLTGIAVLSEDQRIRRVALERLDERGAAPRVLVLIRSWREEGALLAMAGAMTAEQRRRAARIEMACVGNRALASAA